MTKMLKQFVINTSGDGVMKVNKSSRGTPSKP